MIDLSKRALLGIGAVAIGAAGIAGVFLISDDDDDEEASATTTTTDELLDTTTSSTTGVTDTTTSTTAPATTTTTRAATTTTAGAATTTTTRAPTTTVVVTACGTGKAAVAFVAKDLTTDALSSSFIPRAVVDNGVSQPIEVAEITVEVVYPGNDVRTVRFDTAGTVIAPGTSAGFDAAKITTAKQYDSARFTRFTYFTQGQPTACRVSAP